MATLHTRASRLGPAKHLCMDVRNGTIHWARSVRQRGRMQLLDWGSIPRNPDQELEDDLRDLAEQAVGQGQRLEIALRSTRLVQDRTLLPAISAGEARQVAERRAAEIGGSIQGESCVDYALCAEPEATVLWLTAAPEEECRETYELWARAGFQPERLQSRHLALGQLVHFAGNLEEGELIAIFDLERDSGTCVLADRHGWIFGREVPLRFMGRSSTASTQSWLDRREALAVPLDVSDTEGSVADPEGPDGAGSGEGARQSELLATELRRTFRYVQGHLGTGPVSRVWLTGEVDEIAELADQLGAELELPVELLECEGEKASRVAGAAAAIGMACAPDANGGNLLPAEVRRRMAARRTSQRLCMGIGAAAALTALIAVGLLFQVERLKSGIAELDGQWQETVLSRQKMAETALARRRAGAIDRALEEIDGPKPSWTQLLQTLGHTIPDFASVQRLTGSRASEGWDLTLAVEASGDTMAHAAQAVSDFAQRIEGAPFATIDEITRSSAPGGNDAASTSSRVRFRLDGRLAPIESIHTATPEGGDA